MEVCLASKDVVMSKSVLGDIVMPKLVFGDIVLALDRRVELVLGCVKVSIGQEG